MEAQSQMTIPFHEQAAASWTNLRSSMDALSPQQRRVLLALMGAGADGCSNVELAHPSVCGIRFGGRICELRKSWLPEHGYEILTENPCNPEKPGLRMYRLVKRAA